MAEDTNLETGQETTDGSPVGKASTPCPKINPPCWKKFPQGAEPYLPKGSEAQEGWGLKQSDWMNVQQQHHGNCAVQTAQLLSRFGQLQFGKNNGPGFSEDEMEIIANCPNPSGYNRKNGTKPAPSLNIYSNAGMITCHHKATPEDIEKALKRNFPISTGHDLKYLWGSPSGGGHRVATVGSLKEPNTGEVKAYLVHDTGRGCVYYVPKDPYEKSLNGCDMIIVVGTKKNCKDAKGNLVKPGACCLAAYNKRKVALVESTPEQQIPLTPTKDDPADIKVNGRSITKSGREQLARKKNRPS